MQVRVDSSACNRPKGWARFSTKRHQTCDSIKHYYTLSRQLVSTRCRLLVVAAGTRKKPSKAKPSANAVPQPETFLPEQLNPDSTSSRGLLPTVSGHCPRDTTDTALLLLINAAVLAWESPLLLQRSLRQVADITAAAGCCHAAAMFLHLSMATSVTTQQVCNDGTVQHWVRHTPTDSV